MGTEFNTAVIPASQYYIHTSYVPSYYYAYITLEKWLAANIFRNDLSRVFMASNEYAFRRRFELTDMSQSYDEIGASSLQFPFANYNILNQGWVQDEREATNTAAQIYSGIYVGNTRLRAAAVTTTIPVQFYFDREDDARLAYDKLFFFSFNYHYYSSKVPYGKNTLEIPYAFNIKNYTFNPSFKENDWLKQNRIFVISADFEISTYIIFPPDQPDYNASEENLINYQDGIPEYPLVEDIILDFWTKNMNLEIQNFLGLEAFPIEGQPGVIYCDSSWETQDKGSLENPKLRKCNIYKWDTSTQSYSQIDPHRLIDIDIESIGINGSLLSGSAQIKRLALEELTDNSATVYWDYDNNFDISNLEKITIALNNERDEQEISLDSLNYTFNKLVSNSNYIVYIKFYTKDGTVKKLHLVFTTKASVESLKKTLPKNSLIGLSWDTN